MRDFDPTASEFITSGYIENSRPGGRLYDPATLMAGAGVASGLLGAGSARQAASMQADAANRATELQAAQAAQARDDLTPWRKTGELANNRLAALLGLNGEDQTAQLQQTPGYQFRLNEGMNGVNNSAAARGGLLSGAALKAIQKYGQDYASNEYQNAYNRLSGVSGQGQNAAAGQGSASMQFGAQQGQNTIGAGNALASGVVGSANAWGNAASGAINNYQTNQMMNLLNGPSRAKPDFWNQGSSLGAGWDTAF